MYKAFIDESRQTQHRYMLVGACAIDERDEADIKAEIQALRERHNLWGEMKWTKVSRSKIPAYIELVHLAGRSIQAEKMEIQLLVIDRKAPGFRRLRAAEQIYGMGAYFRLSLIELCRAMPNKLWSVVFDGRLPDRYWLPFLESVREDSATAAIKTMSGERSKQNDLLQLIDVLLGGYGAQLQGREIVSPAKNMLAREISRVLELSQDLPKVGLRRVRKV